MTLRQAAPVDIESLTKERDELTCELARAQHHYDHYLEQWSEVCNENQILVNKRDALFEIQRKLMIKLDGCYLERDALMAAGKLALDALGGVLDFDPDSKAMWSVSGGTYEAHECNAAIEALKKAGVSE